MITKVVCLFLGHKKCRIREGDPEFYWCSRCGKLDYDRKAKRDR